MQREHLSDEQLMLAEAPTGPLEALLGDRPAALSRAPLPDVVVGEIVAITDGGCTPLVLFPGQPGTAALRARTVLDLHGAHVGQQAVLSFENGDASRPIVMGVLRQPGDRPLDAPGQVHLDTDGERMIVNAKQELVLQCGKASITLTSAGKVLIQGSYVSSRSTGVNRLKGGSVQLN
ncbi:DUF6484 domain-containing protein [Piscinibacter gummiphilus]|uniref:DUF6484 domain-containing protein n=1 Tax=Piscinibacter gummiphilus TaxID=946333 RepID=A0ABZ0CM70_9BURK|nr:DUF6484 domain-containing protein [Piscinibacter gummiphilus]WOB06078.1 DUF6484 domain-containing protein [Piscinibacter gummiphilus]